MAWKPIETAPKDGTAFLLYLKGLDPAPSLVIEGMHLPGVGWLWPGKNLPDSRYTPTHWMPLPEPPK